MLCVEGGMVIIYMMKFEWIEIVMCLFIVMIVLDGMLYVFGVYLCFVGIFLRVFGYYVCEQGVFDLLMVVCKMMLMLVQ